MYNKLKWFAATKWTVLMLIDLFLWSWSYPTNLIDSFDLWGRFSVNFDWSWFVGTSAHTEFLIL